MGSCFLLPHGLWECGPAWGREWIPGFCGISEGTLGATGNLQKWAGGQLPNISRLGYGWCVAAIRVS
jgi:hypothetical protein